ncbi:hypothetical protein Aab01nite_76850 [Paractinoplanes abujensis]|nr:hypothetical protein Aab01nite_76850 [Actinoplanes abujensis]
MSQAARAPQAGRPGGPDASSGSKQRPTWGLELNGGLGLNEHFRRLGSPHVSVGAAPRLGQARVSGKPASRASPRLRQAGGSGKPASQASRRLIGVPPDRHVVSGP